MSLANNAEKKRNLPAWGKALIILGLLAVAGFFFILSGRGVVIGSSHLASVEPEVENFSWVTLEGNWEVNLSQGDEEKLVIEAEDNIIPRIETAITDNHLTIRQKPGFYILYWPKITPKVNLTVKNIAQLDLSGLVTFRGDNIQAPVLDINLAGSGDIDLTNVKFNEVNSSIAGDGEFRLQGETRLENIEISGSGRYRGFDFISNETTAVISGSGEIEIWVTDRLEATINGAGKISYQGDPEVTQEVSGSGVIKKTAE